MKTITEPTVEPFTVDQVRARLRFDDDNTSILDEDIQRQIKAAREYAEKRTGQFFAVRTVEEAFDKFPCDEIQLTGLPFVSLGLISYVDENQDPQTIDIGGVVIDDYREGQLWLLPATGSPWPTAGDFTNVVKIQYDVGYAPDKVPGDVQSAMLLFIGDLMENLQQTIPGASTPIPLGVDALLVRNRTNLGV